MYFSLDGPSRRWGLGEIHTQDFLAYTIKVSGDTEIELGDAGFRARVNPRLVYESKETIGQRSFGKIYVLEVSRDLGGDDPVTATPDLKQLADDLLLVMSFVSRARLRWFEYYADFGNHIRRCVRSLTKTGDDLTEEDIYSPIQLLHTRDFVRVALPRLRTLRDEGTDLHLPISYLVSSFTAFNLEERFSYAILTLERLKDLHGRSNKLSKILGSSAAKRLGRHLSSEIDLFVDEQFANDSDAAEAARVQLKNKLPELNRPSFRVVLDDLMAQLDIRVDDLYPRNVDPTFISSRDQFVHSSEALDYAVMMKECARVQTICERIILRMLGWRDTSETPGILTGWLQSAD